MQMRLHPFFSLQHFHDFFCAHLRPGQDPDLMETPVDYPMPLQERASMEKQHPAPARKLQRKVEHEESLAGPRVTGQGDNRNAAFGFPPACFRLSFFPQAGDSGNALFGYPPACFRLSGFPQAGDCGNVLFGFHLLQDLPAELRLLVRQEIPAGKKFLRRFDRRNEIILRTEKTTDLVLHKFLQRGPFHCLRKFVHRAFF